MKSKINFAGICTTLLCFAFSTNTIAQQVQAKSQGRNLPQIHNGQPANIYTYKVFEAPNKMYGYDILQNGKGIFHQPASIPPNDAAMPQNIVQQVMPNANNRHDAVNGFSKEEFAQNAALLSIEKIKKRAAPALTNDEIKQVMTNSTSNTINKH